MTAPLDHFRDRRATMMKNKITKMPTASAMSDRNRYTCPNLLSCTPRNIGSPQTYESIVERNPISRFIRTLLQKERANVVACEEVPTTTFTEIPGSKALPRIWVKTKVPKSPDDIVKLCIRDDDVIAIYRNNMSGSSTTRLFRDRVEYEGFEFKGEPVPH
jgi:hypothetical protein